MKAFGLSYCPLAVLHAERERTVDGEAATDEAVRRQSATEQEAVGSSVEMQDESAGQLRPWRHEDATEQAEVTGQPGGIGHPLTMEHPEAMAHQGATGYPEATNEQMSTRTEAVEQQEPASVPQQAADLGEVTAGGAAADAAGANAVHQEATEQEKPNPEPITKGYYQRENAEDAYSQRGAIDSHYSPAPSQTGYPPYRMTAEPVTSTMYPQYTGYNTTSDHVGANRPDLEAPAQANETRLITGLQDALQSENATARDVMLVHQRLFELRGWFVERAAWIENHRACNWEDRTRELQQLVRDIEGLHRSSMRTGAENQRVRALAGFLHRTLRAFVGVWTGQARTERKSSFDVKEVGGKGFD
ncbi:hypothetical protein B0J12DRAFT_697650 [Macrophomina phaseolina]|uniref:Uncharacterized protein n=1 Tax=Macrophomina phaseolina TaxID=35725 RepID=A0ABQ8GHB3_9PEZI|nr:hypothetical protein B0J12DRAFT_697650 [Macrophomina phaseolina]